MRILGPATAVLARAGIQAATAQTTVIERPATESRTGETRESSDGCSPKTVTKINADGDRKTVRKEACD